MLESNKVAYAFSNRFLYICFLTVSLDKYGGRMSFGDYIDSIWRRMMWNIISTHFIISAVWSFTFYADCNSIIIILRVISCLWCDSPTSIQMENKLEVLGNMYVQWINLTTKFGFKKSTVLVSGRRNFLKLSTCSRRLYERVSGSWNTVTGSSWYPGDGYFGNCDRVAMQDSNPSSKDAATRFIKRVDIRSKRHRNEKKNQ